MSASMRPVKTIWGQHTSLFIREHDRLFEALQAATGIDLAWDYEGEYAKTRIRDGGRFLAMLEAMDVGMTLDIIDPHPSDKADYEALLGNLQVLAPRWREFVDEDGYLEIWAD